VPVPVFKTDKVCKLYNCNECLNKFPPTRLSKVAPVVREQAFDEEY
jgi:hypothetical protein